MNLTITADHIGGTVKAIASKSYVHRLLICAAFSRNPARIRCQTTSNDIQATAACLRALGAHIQWDGEFFHVRPVDREHLPQTAILDCGESGSTFRFLLPVVCALGIKGTFLLGGKLPERPISPLYEELTAHGAKLDPPGSAEFHSDGILTDPDFSIPGNISSQFISGLLFALVLMGGGKATVTQQTESEAYIEMTIDCLKQSGVSVIKEGQAYHISGDYQIPPCMEAEGDWSNAAMWLCAGCVGHAPVTVTGLNTDSIQGDKEILNVLNAFGASVSCTKQGITVSPSALHGITVDAAEIPDLVPVIAALATAAQGKTVIRNAERLRLKESDRLSAMHQLISSLGGSVEEQQDGLIIVGKHPLTTTQVKSHNDHRIVMAAVLAAMIMKRPIVIEQAESINKSYPDFWNDLKKLGGMTEVPA